MPHLIVTPIGFNLFAKYSTLVYHDFNTSTYVPTINSQSERELQLCNTAHLKSCKDIIVKELKPATVPNLFYSICMMCNGYGLYGKFYMGPI